MISDLIKRCSYENDLLPAGVCSVLSCSSTVAAQDTLQGECGDAVTVSCTV